MDTWGLLVAGLADQQGVRMIGVPGTKGFLKGIPMGALGQIEPPAQVVARQLDQAADP